VPFVQALRAEVGRVSPGAAAHVHFGATSQDVLDSAMALCLRPCLDEADAVLGATVASLVRRAREHRSTPMLGRTLMQPALPITAGLKLARWAAALHRDRQRLARSRGALAVQLGGPVGALEAMGGRGSAVRARLAQRLGLADAIAWHTDRGDWIALLGHLTQGVLSAGKIALDLSLLSQAEVGEMREAPEKEGHGGSSAMPHKRNPVACAQALAAATRAPALLAAIHAGSLAQHERALGGWQAELTLVPELAHALGSALDFLEVIAASLVIDARRMRANLEAHPEAGLAGPRAAAGLEAALDELLREIET
jgi:3-carboxy-cis,cis-muconate cycloisomerase